MLTLGVSVRLTRLLWGNPTPLNSYQNTFSWVNSSDEKRRRTNISLSGIFCKTWTEFAKPDSSLHDPQICIVQDFRNPHKRCNVVLVKTKIWTISSNHSSSLNCFSQPFVFCPPLVSFWTTEVMKSQEYMSTIIWQMCDDLISLRWIIWRTRSSGVLDFLNFLILWIFFIFGFFWIFWSFGIFGFFGFLDFLDFSNTQKWIRGKILIIFLFFNFQNPMSGSSLITAFHSKIVIIIMTWTSPATGVSKFNRPAAPDICSAAHHPLSKALL